MQSRTGAKSASKATLLRRLGLDGNSPATLEEAGRLSGVTREYVRQMQVRLAHELRNEREPPNALTSAIAVLTLNAPLTANAATQLLVDRGIVNEPLHPETILIAAELFGLNHSLRTQWIRYTVSEVRYQVETVLVTGTERHLKAAALACRRAITRHGAVPASEVIRRLPKGARQALAADDIERNVRFCEELRWVTDINGTRFVYSSAPTRRSRLFQALRKVLLLAPSVSVAEALDAFTRYLAQHAETNYLTPDILLKAVAQYPEFVIDAGRLSWRGAKKQPRLNVAERGYLSCLQSKPGCVATSIELATAAVEAGAGHTTALLYLGWSVLLRPIDSGLHHLIGTSLDQNDVAAAARRHQELREAQGPVAWDRDESRLRLCVPNDIIFSCNGNLHVPKSFGRLLPPQGFSHSSAKNIACYSEKSGFLAPLKPLMTASDRLNGGYWIFHFDLAGGSASGEWVAQRPLMESSPSRALVHPPVWRIVSANSEQIIFLLTLSEGHFARRQLHLPDSLISQSWRGNYALSVDSRTAGTVRLTERTFCGVLSQLEQHATAPVGPWLVEFNQQRREIRFSTPSSKIPS